MKAFNYDILKSKRKRAGDPETPDRLYPFNKMAERMGFEPMMEYNPHTRLAGERLQPARPSLPKIFDKAPFLPNFFVRFQILILKILPCIPAVKILTFLEIEQK